MAPHIENIFSQQGYHDGTLPAPHIENIFSQQGYHDGTLPIGDTSPHPPISSVRDKPPALIAKPNPSRPPPRNCHVEGVTLASSIHCPTHTCDVVDDYVFLGKSKLGNGKFGIVKVVQHRRTKERRACKKIPVTHIQQWNLINKEIELLTLLNHPNILRLIETYEDKDTIFLLMELCEGGELFHRIVNRPNSPITEEQVSEWMGQILSAIGDCHAKGIVHRDLKPENIVCVDSSETSALKLIDFGLASKLDAIKRTEIKPTGFRGFIVSKVGNGKTVQMQRAGTPHYMAPELINGNYDTKCDIFSAGVIMYQLLSGMHPFHVTGDDAEKVQHKILNYNPPTDGDAWADVSSEAKKLLRWMLEKVPSKRCSAKKALEDSWFKTMERPKSGLGSQLLRSTYEGLKDWQNQKRLKQAALLRLAKQLSEGDITELRKKFIFFDLKGDGTISVDELRNTMSRSGHAIPKPDEMQKICDSLDGGDGRIGYNEFISALLARRWNFPESQLREVFNQFDVRGEGHITNKDLQIALKGTRYGQLTDSQIEQILKEADQNDDGKIDFYEFVTLMTN